MATHHPSLPQYLPDKIKEQHEKLKTEMFGEQVEQSVL